MLPLKLIIRECMAFSDKIFGEKPENPHPNHFLKILWKSMFWNAIFWEEMLQNFFRTVIIALYQKTAFLFNPGPQEVPEPENTSRGLARYSVHSTTTALTKLFHYFLYMLAPQP